MTLLPSCAGNIDKSVVPEEMILHLDYRSGGDAPLGFLLTVFDDGRVRFHSASWKTHWSRLGEYEEESLRALLQSPELELGMNELASLGVPFSCCDAREVGILLSDTTATGGDQDVMVPLRFEAGPWPPAVVRLLRLADRIGRHQFRFSYSVLPLPLDELRDI